MNVSETKHVNTSNKSFAKLDDNSLQPDVVQNWKNCRNKLMTPAAQAVFSSKLIANTGLG